MDERYFLKADWQTEWTEVTKEQWVRAERAAGFRNTLGKPSEPATGGFGGSGVSGRIVNMKYTSYYEEHEPLFYALLMEGSCDV